MNIANSQKLVKSTIVSNSEVYTSEAMICQNKIYFKIDAKNDTEEGIFVLEASNNGIDYKIVDAKINIPDNINIPILYCLKEVALPSSSVTYRIMKYTVNKPTVLFTYELHNEAEDKKVSANNFADYKLSSKPLVETGLKESNFIYPNPAENIAYINNFLDYDLTIYNMSGKILKTENIDSDNFALSLNEFSSGVYIIEISKGRQSQFDKLIIKK